VRRPLPHRRRLVLDDLRLRTDRPLGIARILRTLSSGIPSFYASSSRVGSRPISGSIWRAVRTTQLTVSTMFAGTRIARSSEPSARVISCFSGSVSIFAKVIAALTAIKPIYKCHLAMWAAWVAP